MPSGQPLVKLSQKAQELLIKKGPFDLKISLSGTKELAIAFVIIFCNQIFNKQS
jgi:phosphopantetheinyl transferase (holo-ACP synthase)